MTRLNTNLAPFIEHLQNELGKIPPPEKID